MAFDDGVSLLIHLEEMGFDTVPETFVQAAIGRISEATYFTDSQITIMGYEKQKHRKEIRHASDAARLASERTQEEVFDDVGRHIFFVSAAGKAIELRTRGSRFKSLAKRESVECDYCGCQYTKGDPASSLYHRTMHAREKRLLDPPPIKQFADRLSSTLEPELVVPSSPMWMHREMYERALRFKRDFHYDHVQWDGSHTRKNLNRKIRGYLFTDYSGLLPRGTAVGACAFALELEGWSLIWVWICPKMRRSGALSRRWPAFLNEYGNFHVGYPLSEAMQEFLRKQGTPTQRAIVEQTYPKDG